MQTALISVSVKVLIYDDVTQKALFIKEAPYEGGQYPGRWDLPGGRMGGDDKNVFDTAAREVYEEVGFRFNRFDGRHCSVTHDLGTMLRVVIAHRTINPFVGGSVKLSKDHSDYCWMNYEEVCQIGFEEFMPGLHQTACCMLSTFTRR